MNASATQAFANLRKGTSCLPSLVIFRPAVKDAIYKVALPALKGDSVPVNNETLLKLSLAIIKVRPGFYFKWLLESMGIGLVQMYRHNLLILSLGVVLLLSYMAMSLLNLLRRGGGVVAASEDAEGLRWARLVMGVIAWSYLFMGLVLVVLVELPLDRYISGIDVFLPSLFLIQIVIFWLRIGSAMKWGWSPKLAQKLA